MYGWERPARNIGRIAVETSPNYGDAMARSQKLLLALIIMICIIHQSLPNASEEDLDCADPDADPVIEQQATAEHKPARNKGLSRKNRHELKSP